MARRWRTIDYVNVSLWSRYALFPVALFSSRRLWVLGCGRIRSFKWLFSPPPLFRSPDFIEVSVCARKPVCGLSWADGEDGGKAPQVEEEGTLRRCGSGDWTLWASIQRVFFFIEGFGRKSKLTHFGTTKGRNLSFWSSIDTKNTPIYPSNSESRGKCDLLGVLSAQFDRRAENLFFFLYTYFSSFAFFLLDLQRGRYENCRSPNRIVRLPPSLLGNVSAKIK